jgi:hypothetical protein
MVDPSEHPILARITAQPQLGLHLWALVEPELSAIRDPDCWQVRADDSPLGVILTVHPRPTPNAATDTDTDTDTDTLPPASFVLVLDVLHERDPDRLYAWPEILAVARYHYRAAGRLFVISSDDTLLAWAHELFVAEPQQRPLLVGQATLARVPELVSALAS